MNVPHREALPKWIKNRPVIFIGIKGHLKSTYDEYFVFDPDKSIWVYEEKKRYLYDYIPKLIGEKTWNSIINHPWSPEIAPHIKQGGLNIWIYKSLPFANAPNLLLITEGKHRVLFNHQINFPDKFKIIGLDNMLLAWSETGKAGRVEVVSYDHPTEIFEVGKNEILFIWHPFPGVMD